LLTLLLFVAGNPCWLFGTERANQVEYRPSCPELGDREKTWILEKLG
jgi:hypothetical protein